MMMSDLYHLRSAYKNTHNEKVPLIEDVRWLNFGLGEVVGHDGKEHLEWHHGEVWYRTSYSKSEPWKVIKFPRPAGRVKLDVKDPRYVLPEPAELEWEKQRDLHYLCQWMPAKFHALYPDPGSVQLRGKLRPS